jgi:hypothetical protein
MVIDILKLLCDDDGTFQDTGKSYLLECLENKEDIEAEYEAEERAKETPLVQVNKRKPLREVEEAKGPLTRLMRSHCAAAPAA